MEAAPTDILLLIFQIYTDALSQSPTLLLPVCRRWNNVIINSPILWSLVRISVDSIKTVPKILNEKDGGLLAYLSRSEQPNTNIPLDIEIRWLSAKDKAADHLSTCMISPLEVFQCRDSRCELLRTRQDQLCDLLQELAGPKKQPSKGSSNIVSRVTRWRSLLLDLDGLFNSPSERDAVSLWPLGSGDFRVLPRLEYLCIRNASIPDFNLNTPNLRHLEFDRAQTPRYRNVENVERIAIYGGSNMEMTHWDRCHRLKVLEVWSMNAWKLPTDVPFASLKTIALDTSASSSTLISIGEVFNDSRPLDTLIILGMSPEGLSYLLMYGKKMRCRNLLLSSHCFAKNRSAQRPHFGTALEGWVGIHRGGRTITPGDIINTRAMLIEMKNRGTRVTAVESHMETILQMARRGYPGLETE